MRVQERIKKDLIKLPVVGQCSCSFLLTGPYINISILLLTTSFNKGFLITLGINKLNIFNLEGECLYKISRSNVGIDSDIACEYWFSFDSQNHHLRFGKGEARPLTMNVEYCFGHYLEELNCDWFKDISQIYLSKSAKPLNILKTPIVIELPSLLVDSDSITMDTLANYSALVASDLPIACQNLYSKICGKNFSLESNDFPDFVKAIERSIQVESGWCYQKLKQKSLTFGKQNIKATYLRITMGVNLGSSPGSPYVLEIWPLGHYSPIHRHAETNAIIRVLHGEITVNLFSMLSRDHKIPFAQRIFKKNQATWITPTLNQTHQLCNNNEKKQVCVTIQCYEYDGKDDVHYEFFDYLNESSQTVCQFKPASDMDFIEFKALMYKEWQSRDMETEISDCNVETNAY